MLDHYDLLDQLAAKEGKGYAGPLGFEGTADKLLKALNDFTSGEPRPIGWPRSPRSMSGQLRRIAPALRKLGYGLEFTRTTDAAHERIIVIDTAHSRARALNCYAPKSASTANDRPNRPHRPSMPGAGYISDGADGSDGAAPYSRISGLSSLGAATGPADPGGVSFMITNAQRAELRARGYTDDAIAHLLPSEAHHILAEPPKPAEAAASAANGGAPSQPELPLGERVREARRQRDLTQTKLAKLARCPQPAVSQYELGRRVSAAVEARILAALEINPPAAAGITEE
jgi:DNA-binding transcriptional regulator YiaG